MTEAPLELPTGVVDAHAHVFHRSLTLAAHRRYAPDYDAPLNAYLAMLDEHGIEFGVLVQPSFLGTDNSFLLESLKAASGRLRGIAVVPETISREDLRWLSSAGISGIRLNLIGVPTPDFATAQWITFFQRLEAEDMHVEVQCRCTEAGGILRTLNRHIGRIVLDHFGLPETTDPAYAEGLHEILRLGSGSQVYVKLSAPYRFLENDSISFVRPFFQNFLNSFGANHLLWGSDWPHTRFEARGDMGRALQTITALVPDAGALGAIVGETARTLYGFNGAALSGPG